MSEGTESPVIGSRCKLDFGSSEYKIISLPAIRLVRTSRMAPKAKIISKRVLATRYLSICSYVT